MTTHQELDLAPKLGDSALTIGVFDGVHRGHIHLFEKLKAAASARGRVAGVVTFVNHPAAVLNPNFDPAYLATKTERLGLITKSGVDYVVPVTFDRELASLTAGEFAFMLMEHLAMRELIVGPDFAMGRGREGDPPTLSAIGRDMGFSVSVVEPLIDGDGEVVRSTAVRLVLRNGDVAKVSSLLGRNFVMEGTVVEGFRRGTSMGFPTANLSVGDGMAVPGDGIYATWAVVDGRRVMAATSIGTRPTFNDSERTIETYLLDFDGDLYGKELRIEFVRRLRDEVKFDSIQELQTQIAKDVDEARAVLASG